MVTKEPSRGGDAVAMCTANVSYLAANPPSHKEHICTFLLLGGGGAREGYVVQARQGRTILFTAQQNIVGVRMRVYVFKCGV